MTKKIKETKFASQKIAKEIKKVFGSKGKTFTSKLQYKRQVGTFVRKIEKAHKDAAKSKLVF